MKKTVFFLLFTFSLKIYAFSEGYYKRKEYTTRILPVSVAADNNGNIYIGDRLTNSIIKYNEKGKYLYSFGKKKEIKDKGARVYPLIADMFINKNKIYLLDMNSGISIFDIDGNIEKEILLKEGKLLGEVKKPQSIFVDDEENIYITDTENNRIQILGANGEPGREFGYKGNMPGNFIFPKGITLDSKNIIIADTLNARVCVYDTDGFYEQDIEIEEKYSDLIFVVPEDIFYDRKMKKIYVVDNGSEQIKIFDENYEIELVFGEKGKKKNQFNEIKDIWVDDNKIYVADSLNRCIKVFKKDFEDMKLLKIVGRTNILLLFGKWFSFIFIFILLIVYIVKKLNEKRGIV